MKPNQETDAEFKDEQTAEARSIEYKSSCIVNNNKLGEYLRIHPGLQKIIDEASEKLNSTKEHISNLNRKEILPLEKRMHDDTLGRLTQERITLEKQIHEYELSKIYPFVDVSFLGSMREKKLVKIDEKDSFYIKAPRFAVYSLKDDSLTLVFNIRGIRFDGENEHEYRITSNINLKNDLPRCFSRYFKDESQKPNKEYYTSTAKPEIKDCSLTTNFYGFIPDDVKQKIMHARKFFQDDIYIIAEITEWTFKEGKRIMPETGDPIVGGVYRIKEGKEKVDRDDDRCFFITSFNCTTAENYVKEAFVGNKQLQN